MVVIWLTHPITHVRIAAQRDGLEQDTTIEGDVQVDFLLDVLDCLAGDNLVRGVLGVVDGTVLNDRHFQEM